MPLQTRRYWHGGLMRHDWVLMEFKAVREHGIIRTIPNLCLFLDDHHDGDTTYGTAPKYWHAITTTISEYRMFRVTRPAGVVRWPLLLDSALPRCIADGE